MHLLPYRADPGEIRRYLLAVARGRTRTQLRDNEFSPKTLDGVSAAADALGLAAEGNGALSPLGRKLATAALGFALRGDHTEAVHYGGRAVAAVRQSEATYALDRLDELGQALARPARRHAPARELREEIGATRRELTGSPGPAT
jgi:hypothetical protein